MKGVIDNIIQFHQHVCGIKTSSVPSLEDDAETCGRWQPCTLTCTSHHRDNGDFTNIHKKAVPAPNKFLWQRHQSRQEQILIPICKQGYGVFVSSGLPSIRDLQGPRMQESRVRLLLLLGNLFSLNPTDLGGSALILRYHSHFSIVYSKKGQGDSGADLI